MIRPNILNRVEQPALSKFCGACCCAMLLGKTLAEVLSEFDWRKLCYPTGVAEYLARHAVVLGMGIAGGPNDLRDEFEMVVDLSDRDCLVAVPSTNLKGYSHWIVWDGHRQKFLDPSPNPGSNYIIEEIWPITYFVDPDLEIVTKWNG